MGGYIAQHQINAVFPLEFDTNSRGGKQQTNFPFVHFLILICRVVIKQIIATNVPSKVAINNKGCDEMALKVKKKFKKGLKPQRLSLIHI